MSARPAFFVLIHEPCPECAPIRVEGCGYDCEECDNLGYVVNEVSLTDALGALGLSLTKPDTNYQ